MARNPNTLGLTAPMATESTFSIVFRGYSRREVDEFAQLMEAQLIACCAERLESHAVIRSLTEQLREANIEIVELRQRPELGDKLSFRHLGGRVERILVEAEQQADALRQAAAESARQERELVTAQSRLRRDELEQELTRLRQEAQLELAQAKAYAQRLRTEVAELLRAVAERLRAEVGERLRAGVETSRVEAALVVPESSEPASPLTCEALPATAEALPAPAPAPAHATAEALPATAGGVDGVGTRRRANVTPRVASARTGEPESGSAIGGPA